MCGATSPSPDVVRRGRLRTGAEAPVEGENELEIARVGGSSVRQILSGALAEPVSFDQSCEEWVVVLEGSAVLVVENERLELRPGDWVLLPAHTPHQLESTTPGTSWLALHSPAGQ